MTTQQERNTPLVHCLRRLTVPLRRIPLAVLVLEPIRRAFGRTRSIVQVRDFEGSLTMELSLADHMASQIFWYGSYSREILALLRRLLKLGMTFIDVGANIGEVSLAASRLVGPAGKVLSFEPASRVRAALIRNIQLNRIENITVFEQGLSNAPTEASLYESSAVFSDGLNHSGLATLYLSDTRSQFISQISLVRLDDIVGRSTGVDVIKLDIEGAELPALQGAQEILEKNHPLLIVEINRDTCRAAGYEPQQILEFLGRFGYVPHLIGRYGRLSRLRTLSEFQNVLFVPVGFPLST